MRSDVFALVALAVVVTACEPAPAPDEELYVPAAIPGCVANADGRIEKSELPFVVGATARVRVGQNIDVDVNGKPGQGSARVWDLSRPDPDDEPTGLLTLEGMDGQWFADSFPDADVAGPLQPGNGILGPLRFDSDGVKLLGSVSNDENPPEGQTLLAYDDPVTLYPFPFELGASARTETQATNATILGVPFAVADTYDVKVTGHGKVVLPDLILDDALRVTVRLERVPVAGFAVQQVTHVFVNECVGEVARIVSPFVPLDEELPDDFPVAAEVWRLSL
jgi:hypothetical protein